MSKNALYSALKAKYQQFLEIRERRRMEKGVTIGVSSDLVSASSSDRTIRFGVIGTGHVFDRWMHDMGMLPEAAHITVKAVCSRTPSAVREKANRYGISVVYENYEEMLSDPEIDAVYVATPNHLHASHVIQALMAGKHVLCEKPVCVNSSELQHILDTAKKSCCVFMEGMWMRTLPMIHKLQEVVHSGVIGDVKLIHARCCNSDAPEDYPSLYSAEKAGGALMDVGCYCLHFADLFAWGDIRNVQCVSDIASTGVDRSTVINLQYDDCIAMMYQSLGAAGGASAVLHGTKGSIEIPMFLSPSSFTVTVMNGMKTIYRYNEPKNRRPIGYAYEILHFADYIRSSGMVEEQIPIQKTISILRTMDQIRAACNIHLGSELQKDR